MKGGQPERYAAEPRDLSAYDERLRPRHPREGVIPRCPGPRDLLFSSLLGSKPNSESGITRHEPPPRRAPGNANLPIGAVRQFIRGDPTTHGKAPHLEMAFSPGPLARVSDVSVPDTVVKTRAPLRPQGHRCVIPTA